MAMAPAPANLSALLGAMGGGGGQPQQGGDPYGDDSNPLDVLQECIQSLPKVISALPDPQDTQDAVQALLILTKIQNRMMSQSGPSSAGSR